MTPEQYSKVRAELSCLSHNALKRYKVVLTRIGKAAGNPEAEAHMKETLRLVDYLLEETAELEF